MTPEQQQWRVELLADFWFGILIAVVILASAIFWSWRGPLWAASVQWFSLGMVICRVLDLFRILRRPEKAP